jgi:hypothetical protein
MEKIPTIFERGADHKVTSELVVPPILIQHSLTTEKVDGTNAEGGGDHRAVVPRCAWR